MRKPFALIALGILTISCGTQKPAKQPVKKAPTTVKTPAPAPKPKPEPVHKPKVQRQGGAEFFRENIANPDKNDNTASYGSIVTAETPGYKVVKDYFPAVAQNFRQRYIILHYTALDHEKSVRVLTQQAVSAHYLVNELDDNEIYQLVDENKRAYHAGISAWRNDRNLNDTSIGIEIVNAGYTTDASGTKIFTLFPPEQVDKVASLLKDLAERYMIPATNILGHSDIAPTRKQDPGPAFPWKQLYEQHQIGMWYDESTKDLFMQTAMTEDYVQQMTVPSFVFKIQTALRDFGYDISPTGIYDDATKKTVEAFQYHFRPQNYSGMVDAETWAILQALLQKYPRK